MFKGQGLHSEPMVNLILNFIVPRDIGIPVVGNGKVEFLFKTR